MVAVSEEELTSARHKMVTEQLAPRGIKDIRWSEVYEVERAVRRS